MDRYKLFNSRIDEISISEISEFMKKYDNEFFLPLIQREGFKSYDHQAERFLKNGTVLFFRENDTNNLIAFTVILADPQHYKLAYWSYIIVDSDYRRFSLATLIFNEVVKICKSTGMKGLWGSCSEKNK